MSINENEEPGADPDEARRRRSWSAPKAVSVQWLEDPEVRARIERAIRTVGVRLHVTERMPPIEPVPSLPLHVHTVVLGVDPKSGPPAPPKDRSLSPQAIAEASDVQAQEFGFGPEQVEALRSQPARQQNLPESPKTATQVRVDLASLSWLRDALAGGDADPTAP
jgi:hypothetical protein